MRFAGYTPGMPGNPLVMLLAWLVRHLVAFSLLGFAIAGLFVFGVVDMRWDDLFVREGLSPTQADRRSLPREQNPRGEADAGRSDGLAQSVSRQPELIGGSLPVYARPRVAGEGPADSFRPINRTDAALRSTLSRQDYLQQARRAFWNGEFESAEIAYMALIGEYPADADAFGELGNLYKSMGRSAEALDAYYAAGLRLKAAGDADRLQQVIDILRKASDDRAADLLR
ncbi:MAG: tetratricopeptide repeat protein [Sedimenticolaceae bacterium]